MPITILPAPPHGIFAPGAGVQITSDFIGPIQTGSTWFVQGFIANPPNPEALIAQQTITAVSPQDLIKLFAPVSGTTSLSPLVAAPQDGDTVTITVDLRDPAHNVLDHGTQNAPWNNTAGMVTLFQTQQTGGGLTPVQEQQLTNIEQATALSKILDTLTLTEVTSGPTGGFVGANLLDTVFGILIRLANIPADIAPITPDDNYWLPTLAVVRIFRGSDLWIRAPIHTSSKIISLEKEGITTWITAVTATQWALNMTLQVNFLAGVTGQVFIMRFP